MRNKGFVVVCRVTGGVTGTREALLKQDGQVRYFESEADAATEAARLMATANTSIFRTANYQYWADKA